MIFPTVMGYPKSTRLETIAALAYSGFITASFIIGVISTFYVLVPSTEVIFFGNQRRTLKFYYGERRVALECGDSQKYTDVDGDGKLDVVRTTFCTDCNSGINRKPSLEEQIIYAETLHKSKIYVPP